MTKDIRIAHYIDQRFADHSKEHAAMATALNDTREALEYRLEALNNLRDEVIKDRSQYMSTNVYEEQHSQLVRRVESLEQWRTVINARIAVFVALGILGGGAIGTLISQLLR